MLALVVAAVALGLAAWQLAAPRDAGCQAEAWATDPATANLPAGWTVSATQYDIDRKTMSLVGPVPMDDTVSQAVVYVTVTCFRDGAVDSVVRSAKAARDAGQTVTDRSDLGDQAFLAEDQTGARFLQLRHGRIVVYLAASGETGLPEVDALASAFDKALGGDGGAISLATTAPTLDPSADVPAPVESQVAESPAAPELEAALPAEVNGIALTAQSANGKDFLLDDQGSRAILAALRVESLGASDLSVAMAGDDSGESDLTILAITVKGMAIDKTTALVIDSWLATSGSGITRTGVKLNGTPWTQIDYGGEQARDYVAARGDIVYVITTLDPALADLAAAAIP